MQPFQNLFGQKTFFSPLKHPFYQIHCRDANTEEKLMGFGIGETSFHFMLQHLLAALT